MTPEQIAQIEAAVDAGDELKAQALHREFAGSGDGSALLMVTTLVEVMKQAVHRGEAYVAWEVLKRVWADTRSPLMYQLPLDPPQSNSLAVGLLLLDEFIGAHGVAQSMSESVQKCLAERNVPPQMRQQFKALALAYYDQFKQLADRARQARGEGGESNAKSVD